MPAPGTVQSPSRGFGRSRRLRRSRDFQRVARRGRRVSSDHFVLVVAPCVGKPPARDEGRLGLTVSRRVGGAVVRNHVKRSLREWFRKGSLVSQGPLDWIVIARPGAARLRGRAVEADLDALGQRALARVSR